MNFIYNIYYQVGNFFLGKLGQLAKFTSNVGGGATHENGGIGVNSGKISNEMAMKMQGNMSYNLEVACVWLVIIFLIVMLVVILRAQSKYAKRTNNAYRDNRKMIARRDHQSHSKRNQDDYDDYDYDDTEEY